MRQQKSDEYQGYTNRETWALNLWLSNDQGFYNYIRDEFIKPLQRAAEEGEELKYELADKLKEWVGNELMEFSEESPAGSEIRIMFKDIGSLWRIDWTEIAEYWLED